MIPKRIVLITNSHMIDIPEMSFSDKSARWKASF